MSTLGINTATNTANKNLQTKTTVPTADVKTNRQVVADKGEVMPVNTPVATLKEVKVELDEAVKNVATYVQSLSRELQFSVDEEYGGFVVKVLDKETGEVVRQIPTDEIIKLSKNLANSQERSAEGLFIKNDV